MDPVSDILAASKGMPIAAFPGQDHESHITIKMSYLNDPQNGANPVMAKLQPILASNIQEHSVMKYQEQINGMTQQKLQTKVSPEQAQNPAVVQGAMAEAAQEVLNANMAMGKVESPEQQMVDLEKQKVLLEQKKLELKAMQDNAKAVLEAQKLEMEQSELMLKVADQAQTKQFKAQKAQADRLSKQQIKALDSLMNMSIEEKKQETEQDKITSTEKIKAAELLQKMSSTS